MTTKALTNLAAELTSANKALPWSQVTGLRTIAANPSPASGARDPRVDVTFAAIRKA
jgi:hypothetical protein